MNAIGVVEIETAKPLFFDAYERNRVTGSFILIDRDTNATVARGHDRTGGGGHARVRLLAG